MKKRFLAFFIVITMILSQMIVFASGTNLDLGSTSSLSSPKDKITDELKDVMNNTADDEYISIYIWINNGNSDELVYAHLSKKLGREINIKNEDSYISQRIEGKITQFEKNQFNMQQISSTISIEEAFNNMSVNSKISSLRKNAEISSILTDDEIKNCLKNGKSYEYIIELSERYQYLSDYRDSRAAVNTSINERFCNTIDSDKCKDLMLDSLLPYIEMECKKEYIKTLASLGEVTGIGYLVSGGKIVDETMESTENATSTSYENIVKPTNTGYTGSGIRVGVLAASDFNAKASHLSGKTITSYKSSGNATTNTDATKALSVLAGKNLTYNDIEYQGIAPNVDLYFGYVTKLDDMVTMLKWLIISQNVSIVNMTFIINGYDGGYYYQYNEYLDCLVEQYRVVFVNPTGNDTGIVSCPAFAYNTIAVGNMSNYVDANGKYIINSSSNFSEEGYLLTKPDISAFGTDVYMVYNGKETNFGYGTGYAAAIVTGAIALMMEANAELIGKPDAVKAILINSANGEVSEKDTNGEYNLPVCSYYSGDSINIFSQMKNKSGAGLLNIEGAVSLAKSNLIYRYAMDKYTILEDSTFEIGEFFVEKNEQIKFTLVYEKPFDSSINIAFDANPVFNIELYKDNKLILKSLDFHNLESGIITIEESGYYSFVIRCDVFEDGDDENIGIDDNGHTQHDYFYVSMVLSCGCDLPSIVESPYTFEGHDIECKNCQFTCFETNKSVVLTKNYSAATITYEIRYKFTLSIEGLGFMDLEYCELKVTAISTNSNYTAIPIIDSGNTQYKPDGSTIESRTYWIVIADSNYNMIDSFYSTITYSYDRSTGTYYFY